MKKSVYFILFLWIFSACVPMPKEPAVLTGSLQGTVKDADRKTDLEGACVTLKKDGKTVNSLTTGSDGIFNFGELEVGNYVLNTEMNQYESKQDTIEVKERQAVLLDIQLKKKPQEIKAEPDILDFGAEINVKSTRFLNNNTTDLNWYVSETPDWVKKVDPQKEVTLSGGTATITVYIDRHKLKEGPNTATLIISSDAYGSEEITLKAIGQKKVLPKIETLEATDIDTKSAILHAKIDTVGIPPIVECGFVYNKLPQPSLEENIQRIKLVPPSGDHVQVKIQDLEFPKTYYVRSYVTTQYDTIYSLNEISFSTTRQLPQVKILPFSNLDLDEHSVLLNAEQVTLGDPFMEEHGFVWGYTPTPQVSDNKVLVEGVWKGKYSSKLANLPLDKQIYVRAYSINIEGIAYSSDCITFSTYSTLPSVKIQQPTHLDKNARRAVLHAQILEPGTPTNIDRGFVWGLEENPTLSDNVISVKNIQSGEYSATLSNIVLNTNYYVRAYITNEVGTTYSQNSECLFLGDILTIQSEGIAVQLTDIGIGKAPIMEEACIHSTAGGYTDWRLPNYDELNVLFQNQEVLNIKQDPNSYYWGREPQKYVQKNQVSSPEVDSWAKSNYARCVRTLSEDNASHPVQTLPKVQTLDYTDFDRFTAITFHARVVDMGTPGYIQKGFVTSIQIPGYGNTATPTLDQNWEKLEVKGIEPMYSYRKTNMLNAVYPQGLIVYYRAYIITPIGTYYGAVKSFSLMYYPY